MGTKKIKGGYTMNKNQIRETFEMLARSQGLYGRILRDITDEQLDYLAQQNFKDVVDLILFIES